MGIERDKAPPFRDAARIRWRVRGSPALPFGTCGMSDRHSVVPRAAIRLGPGFLGGPTQR